MKPITIEIVKEYIQTNKNGYEILKFYTKKYDDDRNRKHIEVMCDKGHIYDMEWSNFKKCGCPQCTKEIGFPQRQKFKKQEVYEFCELNDIELLTPYRNTSSIIEYRCKKCGHTAKSDFRHLYENRQCGSCTNVIGKTHEKVYNQIKDVSNGEYELISQYNVAKEQITIKHHLCGNSYPVLLSNFMQGKRCPFCASSRGEKIIHEELKNYSDIITISQYRFEDCIKVRKLPFDFAIFDKNMNLLCLIEYQGIQHYEPVDYFGGIESFKIQQISDNIKREYCKNNNIMLIEIEYTKNDEIKNIICELINNIKNVA
jgi:hypothetical protein